MAEEADVDLVEIAPTAVPPVCRLMDYGKFKYQEQKRAHEAKLKQKVISVKEVKFRPGTDDGDYNIKLRNLVKFLEEGDKTKITLRFRGREMAHQEIGVRMLERLKAGSGAFRSGRAVSQDGRPSDGDGTGAKEEEVIPSG
jgi:translation initiation factor IF-3